MSCSNNVTQITASLSRSSASINSISPEEGFGEIHRPTHRYRHIPIDDMEIHGSGERSKKRRKYDPMMTIGHGAFGKIVRIQSLNDDDSDKDLVWKELDLSCMSASGRRQVSSEVSILRSLQRHPHIVRFYEAITSKGGETAYLVMDYCPRGDLSQVIEYYRSANERTPRSPSILDTAQSHPRFSIDENYIWKLMGQITSALIACHWHYDKVTGQKKPILHRDLKPANMLLDKHGNVKLADFGLATDELLPIQHSDASPIGQHGQQRVLMGTPSYLSPERVNNDLYDERSDIWSFGCIIYELMALHPAFEKEDQAELFEMICNGRIDPLPSCYREDLHRTCAWMMRRDFSRRPRIEDIARRIPQLRYSLQRAQMKVREFSIAMKAAKLQREFEIKREWLMAKESALLAREARADKREFSIQKLQRRLGGQRIPHLIDTVVDSDTETCQHSKKFENFHYCNESPLAAFTGGGIESFFDIQELYIAHDSQSNDLSAKKRRIPAFYCSADFLEKVGSSHKKKRLCSET